MCGRCQFSADEYKEIRQIVRDAQRLSEQQSELNFPAAGDICPSQVTPLLVSRGEKIVGEFQQWGCPVFAALCCVLNQLAGYNFSVRFRCTITVIKSLGIYEISIQACRTSPQQMTAVRRTP